MTTDKPAVRTVTLTRAEHDAKLGTPELAALLQHPRAWGVGGVTFYLREPGRDRQEPLL